MSFSLRTIYFYHHCWDSKEFQKAEKSLFDKNMKKILTDLNCVNKDHVKDLISLPLFLMNRIF